MGAIDELGPRSDYWATDAGIDGAGASAEEAAIHVVPDSFPPDRLTTVHRCGHLAGKSSISPMLKRWHI
jgi:hypothetical protein